MTPPPASSGPRIGLHLPAWSSPGRTVTRWAEMRALARDAEALGVDTLWVPDQLQVRTRTGRLVPFWECWTVLSALAEATDRIAIGSLVVCTAFRSPGLLARMAATLDEVSGGRLVLGLGTGEPAADEGWAAFGFDARDHVARFEEAVEIVARLLRDGELTFEGRFSTLRGAVLAPRGPRPGGPPIWVGAGGPRTAQVAARWAAAINVNRPIVNAGDVAAAAELAVGACEAVGRPAGSLRLTGWCRVAPDGGRGAQERPDAIAGDADAIAGRIRALGAAGLSELSCYVGEPGDPSRYPALTRAALERFAPVVERLRAA